VQEYSSAYLDQMYPLNVDDDGDSCDVCRIVDQLVIHNLTLSLVGDSVTLQSVVGLQCALLRRGYEVIPRGRPISRNETGCSWRYCIGGFSQFEVRAPNENNGTACTFNFFSLFRPKKDENNTQIKEVIIAESDIVVFDHGLHYVVPKLADQFRSEMSAYLEAYKNSNLTLVAWRETSAQNYNTTGGHFRQGVENTCVPMQAGQEGFRMQIMKNVSEAAGLSWKNAMDPNFLHQPVERHELVFLPYRNFTIPLHYLHPGECAHYCHTPFVWLPIWRSLRLAMDRAIKGKQNTF
jgi:hypothetical protein